MWAKAQNNFAWLKQCAYLSLAIRWPACLPTALEQCPQENLTLWPRLTRIKIQAVQLWLYLYKMGPHTLPSHPKTGTPLHSAKRNFLDHLKSESYPQRKCGSSCTVLRSVLHTHTEWSLAVSVQQLRTWGQYDKALFKSHNGKEQGGRRPAGRP